MIPSDSGCSQIIRTLPPAWPASCKPGIGNNPLGPSKCWVVVYLYQLLTLSENNGNQQYNIKQPECVDELSSLLCSCNTSCIDIVLQKSDTSMDVIKFFFIKVLMKKFVNQSNQCRRGRTIVEKQSFGTKVPTFGKSLKTFVSEGCTFKKTFKTFVSNVSFKIPS